MGKALLNLIIVFPIIIMLIFVSLKCSQKYLNQVGGKKRLKVIEQIRISSKATLSIIKVGDKYLLIGSGDEHTNLLKELTPEDVNDLEIENSLSQNMNALEAVKHVSRLKEQWQK